MAFLYERTEKQDEIVIVYKYQAAWYLILLAYVLSVPFTTGMETLKLVVLVILACIQIGGKLKPNREIKQAMRNGKVQVSGSKFSFSHPLTFILKK